jgi:hypothetical protein
VTTLASKENPEHTAARSGHETPEEQPLTDEEYNEGKRRAPRPKSPPYDADKGAVHQPLKRKLGRPKKQALLWSASLAWL